MSLDTCTPILSVSEPRGLIVREVAWHCLAEGEPRRRRVGRHVFDLAGRGVASADPRLFETGRGNFNRLFSLSGERLLEDSVDAGWSVSLSGADGQVTERWDARGSYSITLFDAQQRPVVMRESLEGEGLHTVERRVYGEADALDNARGRLARHDGPGGTYRVGHYGLAGAVLAETQCLLRALANPDWPEEVCARDALLEPGGGHATGYGFNALGELIQQTDAASHRRFSRYDRAGQLRECGVQRAGAARIQTLFTGIDYDASGRFREETAGNGVVTRCEYDEADGRLTRLTVAKAAGNVLLDLNYTYDPVGNVTSVGNPAQPVRFNRNQRVDPASHYRYDSLYQLIEATGREVAPVADYPDLPPKLTDPNQLRNYTQRFDYDSAGNLLARHHSGTSTWRMAVSSASNRSLAQRADGSLPDEQAIQSAFDENGNQRQLLPGQALQWNVRNELIQVTAVHRDDGPDDVEAYRYDAGGLRLRKVRLSRTRTHERLAETRYLPGLEWRGNDATGERLHVLTLHGGCGTVRLLHWEAGLPKDMANDQLRYDFSDHLNSSVLELDGEGALLAQEGYYPYGGTAWWSARTTLEANYRTVRYSGKERDATGLYDYGYRYYAPWLQRWMSADPKGDLDGLNLFAMVAANPTSFVDVQGFNRQPVNRWRDAFDKVLSERQPIRVRSRGQGVISVTVSGGSDVFARIGIHFERIPREARHLAYLSIDDRHEGQIAGGSGSIFLKTAAKEELQKGFKHPRSDLAFINGGFFNIQQRSSSYHPPYASIGTSKIGGVLQPSVALPLVYREDYVKVNMGDGSFIMSGPLLAEAGKPRFVASDLDKSRFQFSKTNNMPGSFSHADQPNSRSAISSPGVSGRTRLAVGLSRTRGAGTPGYDMAEWAMVMARLDRLNGDSAGRSVNLDGGGSSSLGYFDKRGNRLFFRGDEQDNRYIGNFLAFSRPRTGLASRFRNLFR